MINKIMTDVLLISENYLRSAFMISDNVQSKFILPAIKYAQETHYQTIVGSCLYKRLLDGVLNEDLSDLERELLNMSKRYIGLMAISELCVITTFKINNIGLNSTSDDKVETFDVNDTMFVHDYYIHQADFHKKRIQQYLLSHRKDFPELCCCDCDSIKSNLYSAASCGIFLGGPRGKHI